MADYEYETLKKKYRDFKIPFAIVSVNGKNFSKNKENLSLDYVEVELTAGCEAAMASFRIYNAFDSSKSQFVLDKVKEFILLGSSVIVCLGYCDTAEPVFCGYIARVNFVSENEGAPYIRVTAMDVKGVMMAGCYAKQTNESGYAAAVEQILKKTVFQKLRERNVITEVRISETPDVPPGGLQTETTAEMIEMVNESDYEFVVRAAKRFNFEFFTHAGTVYFRQAKSDTELLMEIGPKTGLHTVDIEYDITGLVKEIEVRGMDVDQGKVISVRKKYREKISEGNYAKALLDDSRRLYIDAAVDSEEAAGQRAESLLGSMSGRFGSLRCELVGLPELAPGRFIQFAEMGKPVNNTFYVTRVRHVLNNENGYYTQLEGEADRLS